MILALAITGAVLSLFLLAFLAGKPKSVLGDRWLIAWLALHVGYFLALAASQVAGGLWLVVSSLAVQGLVMLFAPTQYLQVIEATRAPGKPAYLRAALAAGIALALLLCLFLPSAALQGGALLIEQPPLWLIALPPMAMVATLYFPLAALQRLRLYRRASKTRLSNLESAGQGWIRTWVWSTIAMLVVQLAVYVTALLIVLPLPLHIAALLCAQCAQIGWAGYHGLRTQGVFQIEIGRVDDSGLVDRRDLAAARSDFDTLETFVAHHCPHLDSELTSPQLADQIGWASERLQRAIRLGGGTRFHDYVNRLRIGALAGLVRDPANRRISLLALAHDAGFGSKSALYSVFKTLEGRSPAAWRRETEQT